MSYKLVYLTPTLSSPAGMERVLHNKVCWLTEHRDYQITIVTTDQGDAPIYFQFPPQVSIVDLGINYSADYSRNPLARTICLLKKRRIHKRKLEALLNKIHPDITITLYPSEVTVVPSIRDGSKKILEFHSHRFFRLNQGYHGIHLLVAKYRAWADKRLAARFDRCVVLTHEGAAQWGKMSNLEVIPNAITYVPKVTHNLQSHRVIAVGRLIYEKGFDRLLKAWALLPDGIRNDWRLDIFGQGECEQSLQRMINELGISSSASIRPPTNKIFDEYANSAFLVMSSRSEGFGMVMLEAMSCGVPVVSFDFKCGPKEIIQDGINGILVPEGDIEMLANTILRLIQDSALRKELGTNTRNILTTFSQERIMGMWEQCFTHLLS